MTKRQEKNKAQDLEKQMESFLRTLSEGKRLLPSTLKVYRIELEKLLVLLQEANPQKLQAHLKKYSAATALRKLVIWRSFLHQCPEPWKTLTDGIPNPKLRDKQPRFLTDEEVFRLETASYRSRSPARDRLFLALGLQLGLRVTEILNLRFSDFQNDWVRLTRKGGKEQILPLTASIQALFHFWKKERNPLPNEFVFPGRGDGPMSVRNAQLLLQKLATQAGLQKKIHPHALRHTFATKMAANGVSLVSLKEFLGHRRLSTTERYLHVTPEHLKESLKFLNPK